MLVINFLFYIIFLFYFILFSFYFFLIFFHVIFFFFNFILLHFLFIYLFFKSILFYFIFFSSNVDEVIKTILNFFVFYEKILHTRKSIKSIKITKTQISEQATFLPLDAFYAHKNAAFFVFVCLYAFCAFCACEIFL